VWGLNVEEVLRIAANAVPGLVVLVLLMRAHNASSQKKDLAFLRHLEQRDIAFREVVRELGEQHNETTLRGHAIIAENTKTLGRVDAQLKASQDAQTNIHDAYLRTVMAIEEKLARAGFRGKPAGD
jgi:hypothetical protein